MISKSTINAAMPQGEPPSDRRRWVIVRRSGFSMDESQWIEINNNMGVTMSSPKLIFFRCLVSTTAASWEVVYHEIPKKKKTKPKISRTLYGIGFNVKTFIVIFSLFSAIFVWLSNIKISPRKQENEGNWMLS
ncbi:hypothetical protein NE237_024114 [Protea cynaroides]|uniref:Uncharacterized protein n=1 Tax=Protea cynaroides TaxID=273540 RepID=A0A9Q0K6M4_9MAGN|nr:hypothetical protein NE237_024114 [Protea cynaroides]